jgi:ribosomal protein S18 acetylase RimI-like enzyme
VRRLNAADAEAFREIRLEGLRLDPDAFGSALSDHINRPLDHFRKRLTGSNVVGCFDGTRLMGIAAYNREQGGNTRHRAMITSVYVRPEARGQGRMAAILAELEAIGRRDGVLQLELHVALDNAAGIAAYERAGYERHGVSPRAILSGGRFIDEVLMVRRLDD